MQERTTMIKETPLPTEETETTCFAVDSYILKKLLQKDGFLWHSVAFLGDAGNTGRKRILGAGKKFSISSVD